MFSETQNFGKIKEYQNEFLSSRGADGLRKIRKFFFSPKNDFFRPYTHIETNNKSSEHDLMRFRILGNPGGLDESL